MSTVGILLPCDGSEPMPISVGDYQHIQTLVGGVFDAVRNDFDPADMDHDESIVPPDAQPFTVVGYVHDEGLLIGLPVNAMASIVFGRELVGPCVLVSGTSPDGVYDSENHDIPEWFANAVFQGGLHDLSQALHLEAELQAKSFRLAIQDGVFTDIQATQIIAMMESGDPRYEAAINKAMETAVAYAVGRATGTVDKFDRAEFVKFQQSLHLPDEEIERFWEEELG